MSKTMRIHRYGGPEELIEETLPDSPPKAGAMRGAEVRRGDPMAS